MKKYIKILTVSMKNSTTYFKDFVMGNVFILLIISIYILLWKNLYSQNVSAGFTFKELIWYLIINEVVFFNNTDLFRKIESEIKSGNIAYHINKPYSYPIYILFDALGKNILSFAVNLVFGLIIGLVFVGYIKALSIINLLPIIIMMLLGVVLNLIIYICISLTSFWIEENRPFIWIYRQFVFAFGGFLVPITLFPKALYNITLHMPWTYVAYHTANSSVKFTFIQFLKTVCWQTGYIIFFLGLMILIYRKGAEALNVNGG